MDASRSVELASQGEFSEMAERLRGGAELHQIERVFLADLLEGKSDFAAQRKDGRRRSRRDVEREQMIADFVAGKIHDGMTEAQAFKAADVEFRENKEERLHSIRKAYRAWGPVKPDLPEFEA